MYDWWFTSQEMDEAIIGFVHQNQLMTAVERKKESNNQVQFTKRRISRNCIDWLPLFGFSYKIWVDDWIFAKINDLYPMTHMDWCQDLTVLLSTLLVTNLCCLKSSIDRNRKKVIITCQHVKLQQSIIKTWIIWKGECWCVVALISTWESESFKAYAFLNNVFV